MPGLSNRFNREGRRFPSWLALGVASLILFLLVIGLSIAWMAENYRPDEFSFNFGANILATVIGVVVGALLAIWITIAVINPHTRHKEEQRLGPLRRPILLFWDHTLTLYTTSILMGLDFPEQIAHAVSDVSFEVASAMDKCANEQKLIELERLLLESDIREEAPVWSLPSFKETLREYRDFLLRMHDTVVALPYLFKEMPEVASGVEMLVGNFLSGEKMIEYRTRVENNVETASLDFYSTAIIKKTAQEAFALVRAARRARVQSQ